MTRMGILGCADIAFRRFMPAVEKISEMEICAVAEQYDAEKLARFRASYDVQDAGSYEALIAMPDIDAIYVPQPPAFHYEWAKKALLAGKHVLVEKPSTTSLAQSRELVELARERNLALHENYMFQYHSQLASIFQTLNEGKIGGVRLIRLAFGFPLREQNDFRYSKRLGGGALLDAAGYTLRLASLLLGPTVHVDSARLNYLPGYEVDMYGSASLSNAEGTVCQIGFGMDCAYQCKLHIWGATGELYTDRIFTAPADYSPVIVTCVKGHREEHRLQPDDHFKTSVEQFLAEMQEETQRKRMYAQILLQAALVDDVRRLGETQCGGVGA